MFSITEWSPLKIYSLEEKIVSNLGNHRKLAKENFSKFFAEKRPQKIKKIDDIMLLLTNCEVHTGKYLDRSFEVRTERSEVRTKN